MSALNGAASRAAASLRPFASSAPQQLLRFREIQQQRSQQFSLKGRKASEAENILSEAADQARVLADAGVAWRIFPEAATFAYADLVLRAVMRGRHQRLRGRAAHARALDVSHDRLIEMFSSAAERTHSLLNAATEGGWRRFSLQYPHFTRELRERHPWALLAASRAASRRLDAGEPVMSVVRGELARYTHFAFTSTTPGLEITRTFASEIEVLSLFDSVALPPLSARFVRLQWLPPEVALTAGTQILFGCDPKAVDIDLNLLARLPAFS